MILTTGGLQGFMNAYGNLLRKARIRWWDAESESHGGALLVQCGGLQAQLSMLHIMAFYKKRETKITNFLQTSFFSTALRGSWQKCQLLDPQTSVSILLPTVCFSRLCRGVQQVYYNPEPSKGPVAMGKQGQLFMWHYNGGGRGGCSYCQSTQKTMSMYAKHIPKAN